MKVGGHCDRVERIRKVLGNEYDLSTPLPCMHILRCHNETHHFI
jgi:hypothetical protein